MWEFAQRLSLALCIILLLSGFAWVWNFLHLETTYPIKTVRFVGTYHHVKPAELIQAAQPHTQTGFFALPSYALQQAIEQLPWVSTCEVIRRWPDTVDVRFKEQQPVARWQETAVLNEQGVVFEPEAESIPKTLPQFFGEVAQAKQILAKYHEFEKIVQKTALSIKEVHVSPSGAWTVVFRNDVVVKVGRQNQERRLLRFVESCRGVFKSKLHGVESVDLRYPSGMAVKWRRQEKHQQQTLAFARSTHLNVKETRK